MKKNFNRSTRSLVMLAVVIVLLGSRKYKEYKEFPYQETIYMPAAGTAIFGGGGNGIYTITPTIQGLSYRYLVDKTTEKFNIPLSVIRSGIQRSGPLTVGIAVNTDTITRMIAAGRFAVADPLVTTELLPAKFVLPSSVTMGADSTLVSFNLSVDLPFITNSLTTFPKKRYAIAVGIASSGAKVDSLKKLTVILIDPAMAILPVASFTSFVDNAYKTAGFVNTSQNGVSYSWNFGDGTPVDATPSASHKYAASGTYTVTLTTTGLTGVTSVKTGSVSIQ